MWRILTCFFLLLIRKYVMVENIFPESLSQRWFSLALVNLETFFGQRLSSVTDCYDNGYVGIFLSKVILEGWNHIKSKFYRNRPSCLKSSRKITMLKMTLCWKENSGKGICIFTHLWNDKVLAPIWFKFFLKIVCFVRQ